MNSKAFTMVELIFVIILIGILAGIAIPKFSSITDGAKKSAEIATVLAVSTALEATNGEWSINEGHFEWGNRQDSSNLNKFGYPENLSFNGDVFGAVIKGKNTKFQKIATKNNNFSIFTGPASNSELGVKSPKSGDIKGKPDKNDFWFYAYGVDDCNVTCVNCTPKTVSYGDFILIDVLTDKSRPNIIECKK